MLHLETHVPVGLTELVPDRLYAISSPVQLDGRVSWAPTLADRWQPVNCYVAVEGSRALLIDTGVAAHAGRTIPALRSLLGSVSELTVVLTRAELDCVSGLGAIAAEFPIDRLLAGGAANPFDAFQEVGRTLGTRELVGLEQADDEGLVLARAASVMLGETRQFDIATPMLRLLATFWVHDRRTAALFTSDIFGHTDLPAAEASPVIDTIDGSGDEGAAALHLLAKHWWLRKANRRRIADVLEQTMRELDPEIVAPTHGCILVGRDVVRHHVDLVLRVLRSESLPEPA